MKLLGNHSPNWHNFSSFTPYWFFFYQFPVFFLTYICRGEQPHIQQESPEEPREQQHTSSKPHGLQERGTQDRQRLERGEITLLHVIHLKLG